MSEVPLCERGYQPDTRREGKLSALDRPGLKEWPQSIRISTALSRITQKCLPRLWLLRSCEHPTEVVFVTGALPWRCFYSWSRARGRFCSRSRDVTGARQGLTARGADVGVVTGIGAHAFRLAAGLRKGLAAGSARVGSVTGMGVHVLCQVAG